MSLKNLRLCEGNRFLLLLYVTKKFTNMNPVDFSKLSEQLNRIEKNQKEIIEFLKEFKSFEHANFKTINEQLEPVFKAIVGS